MNIKEQLAREYQRAAAQAALAAVANLHNPTKGNAAFFQREARYYADLAQAYLSDAIGVSHKMQRD